MKLPFILAILFLSACQTPPTIWGPQSSPSYYTDNTAENNAILDGKSQKDEVQKCKDKDPDCDLVTYQVFANKEVFDHCHKSGKKKMDCAQVLVDMYAAKMALKYQEADFAYVDVWCKSEPIKCDRSQVDGLIQYELKIRESNEQKLAQIAQDKYLRVKAQQAAQDQANRERIAAALRNWSIQTSNQQNMYQVTPISKPSNNINCTTRKIGETTYTNCN